MAEASREVPVADVAHPLVDAVGETADGQRWLVTETRAPVVFLTPGRVNLLNRAAEAGRRVVLVSDELSRLTPLLTDAWRDAGARWVVRDARGGLREGFGGRQLTAVADVITGGPAAAADEMAIGHLRPTDTDAMEVTAVVSVRHPARASTLLGGALSGLAAAALDAPPRAWGMSEPVGQAWDAVALTDVVRRRMPAETMVLAAGPGLAASISAQRTEHGVEEITHAHLAVVEPSLEEFAGVRERLARELTRLAATAMPLMALLLARPGRSDLLRPPLLVAPPAPVSLLVGAPAVRSLGLDPQRLRVDAGAEVVGRGRLPALLFRFGPYGPKAWHQLDEVLTALGPDLMQVLGLAGPALQAERPQQAAGGSGA